MSGKNDPSIDLFQLLDFTTVVGIELAKKSARPVVEAQGNPQVSELFTGLLPLIEFVLLREGLQAYYGWDMETNFQQGIACLGAPMKAVEIPFEGTSLPGYYLEHDAQPRPVVLMIGGGDSFREDLFYVAGYPGWKRGYNVLMVDLPGQGKVPGRGLHYRVDMDTPIRAVLDWLQTHAAVMPQQIAIYRISGGGWHTAQAVANDPRIRAWIAATPNR